MDGPDLHEHYFQAIRVIEATCPFCKPWPWNARADTKECAAILLQEHIAHHHDEQIRHAATRKEPNS